ncbi:MAG TPA: DUF397 domain-containing protein [Trebonia sp.]|nr:DUF397 domain-containing protein [Trebonia sp.]
MQDLAWNKSSYSSANGQCAETARLADGSMAVRDSKEPDGPVLRFSARQWRAFLSVVRAGSHD